MNRSKRLSPIQKVASNKEQRAAKALGESIQAHNRAQQKLHQLTSYRQEYLADMQSKVSQGISGAELQRYHEFLEQLEKAIKLQHAEVEQCEKGLSQSQSQWQERRNQHRAITQAIDKFSDEEKLESDRKEEKLADELTTQSFLRNR